MVVTVKAARVNAGLSQKQTADHLDLSLTAYVRKENGKTKFYADEIVRLSALLGVRVENFFEVSCLIRTHDEISCAHAH